MIPLYIEEDSGTDYCIRWKLNLLALYLITCGWDIGVFVYPKRVRLVKEAV